MLSALLAVAEAPNVNDDDVRVFIIAAPAVQFIVALLIPLLVGLLTKITLPGWVKGLATIVLNGLNALIITSISTDGTALFTQTVLLAWALNTCISIAAYMGVLKPAGLTSSTPEGKLGPNSGLG